MQFKHFCTFYSKKIPLSEGRFLYLTYSSVRKNGKVSRLHVLKKQQFISSLTHGDQSYIFVRKWRWKHPGVYLVILRKWIITSWWSSIYNSDLQNLADHFIQHFHLPIPRCISINGAELYPMVELQVVFSCRVRKRKPLPCNLKGSLKLVKIE